MILTAVDRKDSKKDPESLVHICIMYTAHLLEEDSGKLASESGKLGTTMKSENFDKHGRGKINISVGNGVTGGLQFLSAGQKSFSFRQRV